uniref:Homeobox domain-containing protein n=1 Tax=Meloidogyne enterolobii TaxID=390850 RepID=A0A6V7TL27_MELEN|nr:unnamed protein product [Meloidogyne enterolobii]
MSSQEEETKSKRRTRMNFSEEQICYLEDFFGNTSHYPDSYQKEEIARRLNITMDRITVWFQNRRSKFRKYVRGKNSKFKDWEFKLDFKFDSEEK